MDGESQGPKKLITLGLILLVGSVLVTAWWLNRPTPTTQKTSADPIDVFCTGRVDSSGQVIPLELTQPGRVVKINVKEGAVVKAGEPILNIDPSGAEIRVAQAESAREAARVELDAAKSEKQRFAQLVEAREFLIVAAGARVEAAKKLLQQRREQQSVTPLGKAEEKALEAQVLELEQLEKAEKAQLQLAKDREMQGQGNDLRIRAAEARLKAAEADLKLAQKGVDECTLVAPADGTILRLQASVGGMLAPGSPIAAVVFAPAGPLVVRAEVDQESLGRVKIGMKAEVQDENRADGPIWTGRVKQVAGWVAARRTFVLDPGEINDVRTVETVIELDPSEKPLWIGQRMRVRIIRPQEAPSAATSPSVR